ncbi:MAG: hypothetical protein NVSMB9_07590 [Isosphaeraceae bacterium]
MRDILMFLTVIGAFIFGAPAGRASGSDLEKDYAKFAGTWTLTEVEVEGKASPAQAFSRFQLIIEKQGFTSKDEEGSTHGTFKIDTGKTPNQIDLSFTDGPDAGKTLLGVYEIKGETYKACIAMPGKTRPTGFVTKAGSGHVLEVFKRQKP